MNALEQFRKDVETHGKPKWFVNYARNLVFGWPKLNWSVVDDDLGNYYLYRDDFTKSIFGVTNYWRTTQDAYIQYTEDMSVWTVLL